MNPNTCDLGARRIHGLRRGRRSAQRRRATLLLAGSAARRHPTTNERWCLHDNAEAARTLQALRHNAYEHHQAPLVVRATGHAVRALQSQTQPARAQAADDPAEQLPIAGWITPMESLLEGMHIFATAYNHEDRRLPGLEQRNAVTCAYPGGRPPTCANAATAGLSVCPSLACVGNFRGPPMHSYSAAICLLPEGF